MTPRPNNTFRKPRHRPANHCSARRPGFLLLEVVVAVGLLVMGMAVIGAQLQSATDRAIETAQMSRIVFLAESKLAELNTGMVELELEQEEEFGPLFPAYGWRLLAVPLPEDPNPTSPRHPLDTPMVGLTLQILVDPDRDITGDEPEAFDFDEAVVVQEYYTLRTLPRPLDLTTDFGLDDERAAEINEQLSSVGAGTVDVNELNPAMFRDMSMEELLEVLPVLMPALGVGEDSVLNMVPAELRPLLEAIFAEQREGDGGDSGDDGSGDSGSDDSGSDDSGSDDSGSEDSGFDDDGTDGSGSSGGGSDGGDDTNPDDGQVPPDDAGDGSDGGTNPDDTAGDDSGENDDEQPRRGGRRPRGGGRRGGG